MSRNIKNRPFYLLDLDEYIVAEYTSQEKCAAEMKLQVSKINDCLKGTKKTHGGHKFKYKYQSALWLKHISCTECGHEKENFNITNCPHLFRLICSKCKTTKNLKVIIGEGAYGTAQQTCDPDNEIIISMPQEPFFYTDKEKKPLIDPFDPILQEDVMLDKMNESERLEELRDLDCNDDLGTLEWSDEETRWV
tara:strand:+ start:115 stop:693 length:579 start_codon:yes stop_codon:yes gene_type:complete